MGPASMLLGILSIFIWPIQWCDFLIIAAAFTLGIVVLRRRKSGVALAGIILASIGLVLTTVDLQIGLLDLILKTYFQY